MRTANTPLINIGTSVRGCVTLDLPILLASRVLIQARSGGGKSWLLRLIAERASPHVQVIVIDPEGEFGTLRQAVDLLIVGKTGEIPAEPKGAGVLARKLVEVGVSAAIDLYELKQPERLLFVRNFCEGLMQVPRKHWHQLILMVDEADVFCPERSAGQAESTAAIIDLMCRGRKRGLCTILATHRLSRLHKDAAAEAGNVFVGPTNLDIDVQRAVITLGFPRTRGREIRKLSPGTFFVYGPAFSFNEVERIKVAAVKTLHPQVGRHNEITAPAASEKIRRYLPQLAGLAELAVEEAKDLATAKVRIRGLEREARALQRGAGAPDPALIERAVTKSVLETESRISRDHSREMRSTAARAGDLERRLGKILSLATVPKAEAASSTLLESRASGQPVRRTGTESLSPRRVRQVEPADNGARSVLPKAQGKILAAIAPYPDGRTKRQVALMAGYSVRGGGFNNPLSALNTQGLIRRAGDTITVTDEGLAAVGQFDPLPTGQALVDYWKAQLGKAERTILQALVDRWPDSVEKIELADITGYSPIGGGFNNPLSRLRTLGLIEGSKELRVSETFFQGRVVGKKEYG